MAEPKLKFVLSDLHLGAGTDNDLEDFTADTALVRLIREICHESDENQRDVELILNGDFLEFLQVPAVDRYRPDTRYPPEVYLDSSAAASVKRLNLIIKGHLKIFDALADFMHVARPQRRITLIKGNHDVNLFWPDVKSRLREVVGASGARASLLLFAEEFVSREKIYVEHGHQQAEVLNRYHDFLDPRRADDPTQLFLPVGSRFTINFLNEVERDYCFVDEIKPVTALIWLAFGWDFDFAAGALAQFIRSLPEQNMAGERKFVTPTDIFLRDLENRDKRGQMSQRYTGEPAFREQFHRQVQSYLGEPFQPDHDALTLARLTQQKRHRLLSQAAAEIARQEGAGVVLFGHTHHPAVETLPTGAVYINTGCWLRRYDLAELIPEGWQTIFQTSANCEIEPEQLSYARIDYDEANNPTAQLLNLSLSVSPPEEKSPGFLSNIWQRIVGGV